jgi:hypothetical protein
MAVAVLKSKQVVETRRFSLADLSQHGKWILPRLLQALPHLGHERNAAGWLTSKVSSNEFLFLYQPNAVALAQVTYDETLDAKPLVRERFVWAQSPEHVEAAANFYDDIAQWAKSLGASVIIVEESSDVPHEVVREKLGRIFTRQQQFARV